MDDDAWRETLSAVVQQAGDKRRAETASQAAAALAAAADAEEGELLDEVAPPPVGLRNYQQELVNRIAGTNALVYLRST